MTAPTLSATAVDDKIAAALASLTRKLATPGVGEVAFTAAETHAFYIVEGQRLSVTRTLRAVETEMSEGSFNPAGRRILALDDGSVAAGSEYLAIAGRHRLPLAITVLGGVDLGAAGGGLDRTTLRNSVPKEQRYEVHSRAAAAQILRRYLTDSLHEPHVTIPPSVWWNELFSRSGRDLRDEAHLVNDARGKNPQHCVDSFRAPLIAVASLILSEVRVRAPESAQDAEDFLVAIIAGFRNPDTPKDDPARGAHNLLAKLTEEAKVLNRIAGRLDARAFLAVLVGWKDHVAGKGWDPRDPALNPMRMVNGALVKAPQVPVAIPKKKP